MSRKITTSASIGYFAFFARKKKQKISQQLAPLTD